MYAGVFRFHWTYYIIFTIPHTIALIQMENKTFWRLLLHKNIISRKQLTRERTYVYKAFVRRIFLLQLHIRSFKIFITSNIVISCIVCFAFWGYMSNKELPILWRATVYTFKLQSSEPGKNKNNMNKALSASFWVKLHIPILCYVPLLALVGFALRNVG